MLPTSGKVKIRGRVQTVFSLGTGFHVEMSGYENARFLALLNGLSKSQFQRRYPQILKFSGLGESMNRPLKTYSSGMVTRLAFCLALVQDPDVLLVDEGLVLGDLEFQKRCLTWMKEHRQQGMTMIIATHDLEFVKAYCDEALLIDAGRQVELGEPQLAINTYLNSKDLLPHQKQVIGQNSLHLRKVTMNTDRRWRSGDPLAIHFQIEDGNYRGLHPLVVAISIGRFDGVLCHHCDYRIEMEQPLVEVHHVYPTLPLGRGRYKICVDLYDLEGNILDRHSMTFSIAGEDKQAGVVNLGYTVDVKY